MCGRLRQPGCPRLRGGYNLIFDKYCYFVISILFTCLLPSDPVIMIR